MENVKIKSLVAFLGMIAGANAMAQGQAVQVNMGGSMMAQQPVAVTPQAQPVAQQIPQTQQQNTQQAVKLPPLPIALPPTAKSAMEEAGSNLSPAEIMKLKAMMAEGNKAAASEPAGRPVKTVTKSVVANLSPDSDPIVVRLAMNYPTSVTFIDNTGAPWSVQNWLGGSKNIEFVRPIDKNDPTQESSSLVLQPLTPTSNYTNGGFNVYLHGMQTPIVFSYIGGQQEVDQRVEVQIPRRGPKTSAPVLLSMPPSANPNLASLLDGVPPRNGIPLGVSSGANKVQAWSVDGRIYMRSDIEVISPNYLNGMRSSDGSYAYEFEYVPVFRGMSGGRIVEIKVEI